MVEKKGKSNKKAGKKKTSKKKVVKKNSEKVCETFEVDKKGKEKSVTTCGNLPVKKASKKELDNENKVLRNVLIGMGIFVIVFIVTFVLIQQTGTIEHDGVIFKKIDYSGLPLYHTTFLFPKNGQNILYNEFLRLNPEKTIDNVPFEGVLITRRDMVLNFEETFNCDGDGIIAAANLKELYDFLRINVINNNQLTNISYGCNLEGKYLYLNFLEGEKTKIVQVTPTCYNLYINDCEILDVSERFIIEALVKVNKEINEMSS